MSKEKESQLYSEALMFAAGKHSGQVRKDGTPYILHLIRVSRLIADAGYPIEYQIAGLLHDVLEDTDTSESELQVFGSDVVEAVKLVSKNINKTDYVENILTNRMASAVKNADRIDNIMDACDSEDSAFKLHYLEDSMKYKQKFSRALDIAVSRLEKSSRHAGKPIHVSYEPYDAEMMKLYADKSGEN